MLAGCFNTLCFMKGQVPAAELTPCIFLSMPA